MKDKIADILKEYTKKKGIMASFVILENYAEELVKNGCVIQDTNSVEVVRCKDCENYTTRIQASVKWKGKAMHCKRSRRKVNPNDFCSYGERREK
jgi:hypothetical protein